MKKVKKAVPKKIEAPKPVPKIIKKIKKIVKIPLKIAKAVIPLKVVIEIEAPVPGQEMRTSGKNL